MVGACPPALSIAVSRAGGMGACGALLMEASDIEAWVNDVRSKTNGGFQLNTWIPDPESSRDTSHEAKDRQLLSEGMQVWAGQSAALARDDSAKTIVEELWDELQSVLS